MTPPTPLRKPSSGPPRPPAGLSRKSAALWASLLAGHEFSRPELVALEAALVWWDRSAAWMAESESATGREQATLRKQSMDAAQTALRHWKALKFAAPGSARRPGRPSEPWRAL